MHPEATSPVDAPEALHVVVEQTEGAIAREWDALADRLQGPPWSRPGWLARWRDAFSSRPLELITVRRVQTLEAVFPFERRRSGLDAPVNWHSPAYVPLAASPAAARLAAETALAQANGRLAARLADLETPALAAFRTAAAAKGLRVLERPQMSSPFVELTGTWAEYEASLDPGHVREIHRKERRLARDGVAALEHRDGTDDLRRLLDEGYRVEAAGWKGEQGTAIASQPATRRFYDGIAEWAAAAGYLRLTHLRLDGRSIAFELALEANGVHSMLKHGYDSAFARYSPGRVLQHGLVRDAFERGLRRFEFLGAAEEHKLAWATGSHEVGELRTFDRSPVGAALWIERSYARPLARRIRQAIRRAR